MSLYDPVNYPDANNHYGLLWWNNADGTLPGVPLDAYWSWGLYESFIIVIPSLDLVIARAGAGWTPGGTWNADYSVLAPFIDPIVEAACGSGGCTPVPALGRVWTPTLVGILLACCVQRLRQAGRA
ncbi:MAG: hypothetical protein GY725_09040 [bacterium]|nr:hypothetical protein [bacterium]